jgi:DNA (cytosine-5)-methyltransferase 1
MNFASLFSGVGLLDLGFMRGTGAELLWQCEIDSKCQTLLRKRFGVPVYGDVAALDNPPSADVLIGGFPCQPVSSAGLRGAQDDERWLWPHFVRLIEKSQPNMVVIENVEGLLGRGLGIVLADLAGLGYDAEWDTIPALAVGAPHLRFRPFIVARRDGNRGVFSGKSAKVSLAELPEWPSEEPYLPRMLTGQKRAGWRIEALGNGVVLQIPEWIGTRLEIDEKPVTSASPFATLDDGVWREGDGFSLFGESYPIAEGWAWPRAGFVQDGAAYEADPVFPKRKTDREVWPTISASEPGWSLRTNGRNVVLADGSYPTEDWDQRFYNAENGTIVQRGLTQIVEGVELGLWPTPAARDKKGPNPNRREGGPDLPTAVLERIWPTPQATGGSARARSVGKLEQRSVNGDFLQLADEVRLAEVREGGGEGSVLNAGWVEWLMGAPAGWTDITADCMAEQR